MRKRNPYAGKQNRKKRDYFTIRPFEKLSDILPMARRGRTRDLYAGNVSARPAADARTKVPARPEELEMRLFEKAMEGVIPLSDRRGRAKGSTNNRPGRGSGSPVSKQSAGTLAAADREVFRELNALVSGERPVNISQTPEYVEGSRSREGTILARKLHRGAFAVQAYCDLHGMDSITALETCEEFVSNALREGKRCIAFIHGRGLSSRGRPVLKRLVVDWLSRGPYRKRIIAFASAPAWDGGAGVTYALMRDRLPARGPGR